VLRGTAAALSRAYGDTQIGLTISFIPLPEIGWSGIQHIWGRSTTIYYLRPLPGQTLLDGRVVVDPGGANAAPLFGVATVWAVPSGTLQHTVSWAASSSARVCYDAM
jgi:hypothetical protein